MFLIPLIIKITKINNKTGYFFPIVENVRWRKGRMCMKDPGEGMKISKDPGGGSGYCDPPMGGYNSDPGGGGFSFDPIAGW